MEKDLNTERETKKTERQHIDMHTERFNIVKYADIQKVFKAHSHRDA